MEFIDTHTHLFTEQFDEDRREVIQRAFDAGISHLLLPNIDIESIETMNGLAKEYPGKCLPMIGLHPCNIEENFEQDLARIYQELQQGNYIAVGEIGLDLYWDKTSLSRQEIAFEKQVQWAKEFNLPIAIHVRDAFDEIFTLMDRLNDEKLTGVFHCFTGNSAQAQHIIEYGGFKLGLGGVLTFKNSGLDQVVKDIDLSHFILETDSPYLAPAPHRGKRNESAYLTYVGSKLAEIKGVSIEEIAAITTKNAKELFHI